MKSLIIVALIVVAFGSLTFGQNSCENKVLVGVQIVVSGSFNNPVETEKLAAAVMNFDRIDPLEPYCMIHTSGKSERRLEVDVTFRSLGSERGVDDQNAQIKRAIGQNGLSILINILPKKYRRQAQKITRQFAKNYFVDPRIRWEAFQAEVRTTYKAGDEILWQGLGSRVFILETKSFPGQPGEQVRIISGGSMQELQPYNNAITVPMSLNQFNENRAKQFMKLLVVMDAMLKKNTVVGGQYLLSQSQQSQ